MAELYGGSYLWSFFDAIFNKSGSFSILKDYLCRVKLETLVEKLESSLESIKQVLDDAEIKQYKNPKVEKWVGDVKHAMYKADQLLDEIATDEALRKSQLSTGGINIISPLPNNPFKSRIKELLKSLESLALQTHTLGLKQGTCVNNEVVLGPKPSEILPTTSLVDESDIYVRQGEKEKIINFLLDSDIGKKENNYKGIVDRLLYDEEENASDNQGPAVICIVGLGGMGKTTLAQLVYNDPRVKKHFELKAWVYVSETFDIIALTKAILENVGFPADSGDLGLLQHQLKQGLRRKKYLLVLDDLSDANLKHLEELLLPFKHGSFGSKIVVTTRSKTVARSIDLEPRTIQELEQLDESDCWKLFERHAFHRRSVIEYPRLESIGKSLLDKCRGLPLAVKTLGKLLQQKFSPYEWEKMLDNDLWHSWERDINYNPILRLGYYNLHSNLKRCFAYCSLFPKGYKFEKDKLIKLWIAEGLLCDTYDKEEKVGCKFFDDLESISFFQESPKERSYDRLSFVMHDLVNDLANLVAGDFCLQIEIDKVQHIPERTRHISCFLEGDGRELSLDHVSKIEGLRSLMVQPKGQSRESYNRMLFCNYTIEQHDLFSRLKYLRMLSLFGCNLQGLADEISNLKLLRYLDMSCTMMKKLPESICMLYNLQTLILQHCGLTELPSDFYKLVNLCHFNLLGNPLKKMPKQIGSLHHLQTLTNFVVGEQSGGDVKELAKLNNLEGKLCISGLESVIDPTDAAEANLNDKKYLAELQMTYKYNSGKGEMDGSIVETEVSVLEALQPNSNLNSLTISHYRGSRFPNWLGDFKLSNLESLELLGCKFCSVLPSLGQLPSLKKLKIWGSNGIEIIGEEFYVVNNSLSNVAPFRSLEFLRFYDMSEWKEWFCGEGCFPMLKELCIEKCPKLKMDLPQHLPSLKKLKIVGCGQLEASIPKADNLTHLNLCRCKKILVNEFPSSLTQVYLVELLLDGSAFVGCSSPLDLHYCPSLRRLSITGWCYSSFPFIGLSTKTTNLHYLRLYDCPQLELFPTGGLPSSIRWLEIDKCPKLIASREDLGFPASLIHLEMRNCPKLIASREEWGLFKLNSLEALCVADEFENVESFPEENLLPPTVEILWLYGCSKLRIINYKGLLHLKSLKNLWISGCPCLERLPEEGLPNSLSSLDVQGCSLQLKQMYEKETGERWYKISYIPNVSIEEKIQCSSRRLFIVDNFLHHSGLEAFQSLSSI